MFEGLAHAGYTHIVRDPLLDYDRRRAATIGSSKSCSLCDTVRKKGFIVVKVLFTLNAVVVLFQCCEITQRFSHARQSDTIKIPSS